MGTMDGVFIMSAETGEVLIEHYTPGSRAAGCGVMEAFWSKMLDLDAAGLRVPADQVGDRALPSVMALPQCYLFHTKSNTLVFACAAQKEIAPLLVLEFLSHLIEICSDYFGSELSCEDIRDNTVTIYQLLEEMLDGGHPYLVEANTLKELIQPPRLLSKMANALRIGSQVSDTLPDSASSNIPWRRSNVRYASNEIYVDMIEELDATIDCNGFLSNIGIIGQLMVNCKLSGIPDLTISFNRPDVIDDCRLHPCVRHLKFASDRVLSFVPPDGNFKLMSYKISSRTAKGLHKNVIPFYVKPQITYKGDTGRMSIMVGLKTDTNPRLPEQVAVKIPLPASTVSADMSSNVGSVTVDIHKQEAIWRIGKVARDRPACLNGSVILGSSDSSAMASPSPSSGNGNGGAAAAAKRKGLPANQASSGTFEVSFQLQGSTLSGLTVDAMEITNVKYKPFKGVKYATRSGYFQIRTE